MKPTVTVRRKNSRPWRGRTVRPLRGRPDPWGARSLGGGHKKRALAHGYPILPNLNPFGVPTPTGTKGKQEHELPAFEADQLIKPPACGRCLTQLTALRGPDSIVRGAVSQGLDGGRWLLSG